MPRSYRDYRIAEHRPLLKKRVWRVYHDGQWLGQSRSIIAAKDYIDTLCYAAWATANAFKGGRWWLDSSGRLRWKNIRIEWEVATPGFPAWEGQIGYFALTHPAIQVEANYWEEIVELVNESLPSRPRKEPAQNCPRTLDSGWQW